MQDVSVSKGKPTFIGLITRVIHHNKKTFYANVTIGFVLDVKIVLTEWFDM